MTTKLQDALNRAQPQSLPDMFRTLGLGDMLASLPKSIHAALPAVGSYNIATIRTIPLPEGMKALSVIRAYARAGGSATPGPLAIEADAATAPSTLSVKVTPTGDIAFLGTDAWTSVDVDYIPAQYDIVEATCPCVAGTGVVTLPPSMTGPGVLGLMEAEILVGTLKAKKFIVAPAATAPATTLAGLNLAKTSVFVAIADAATSVRIKVMVARAINVGALLVADSNAL